MLQDAQEDLKKMAAKTPAKEKDEKEPDGSEAKGRRRRKVRTPTARRRLFASPSEKGCEPVPGDTPGSLEGSESGEDKDVFGGRFARATSSLLVDKREANSRPSTRSSAAKKRKAASPLSQPKPKPDRRDPASVSTKPRDSGSPEPEFETKEEDQAGDTHSCIDAEVVDSLPAGLSERDTVVIKDILVAEDLLNMNDCLDNLLDVAESPLALRF
ncbi:unnamed protein product [Symbiodinium sp. CCMP2592]|nr:unnamed protein product [Symbiodinium sp. CCMP2592]